MLKIIRFATKPALAVAMVHRTVEIGAPFAWVTAETVYELGELEMALRCASKGYVLGVAGRSRSTLGPGDLRCPTWRGISLWRFQKQPGKHPTHGLLVDAGDRSCDRSA